MQQKKHIDTPIQYLKGIGPKRAEALQERGIKTVRDLLYYFPFDYIDLSSVEPIGNLRGSVDSGKWVTVIGKVRTFDLLGRPPRQRFVVILGNGASVVQLVFFRSIKYFKNAFTEGETLAVSGKATAFRSQVQFIHPAIDRITAMDDEEDPGFLHTGGIVPKYGSSESLRDVNLHVKGLRRIVKSAVDEYAPHVVDYLPLEVLRRNAFIPLPQALSSIHFPESNEALEKARRRLKFDELFSFQIMLALRRQHNKQEFSGIPFKVESALARQLVDSLPYTLTKAQVRVIKEIAEDMKSSTPMNRMLQGDVGSGKTIVALIAMMIAVENGFQAAFMAPTEILAEQHYKTLSKLLNKIPLTLRILVGHQKSKLREDVLEDIRRGSANIVVGTHALIQENVAFAKLGLAVIDEQHRFGVEQRVALKAKGDAPHPDMLVMTATPIPRTLSMTLYGDLDVSIIDELPANRHSIATAVRTEKERQLVYKFVSEQINEKRQVYIVYPLIDISEKLDLQAATEGYKHLSNDIFPDHNIGIVHGRMDSDEKDRVMSDFQEHRIDILVATSVIEVGIDIPNATVMVIEHAERFGLSQLHQLRGRVGRGSERSYCILMAPQWISQRVKRSMEIPMMTEQQREELKVVRRLQTMVETVNGFTIAEIDLELRGPGDFFGTRQSGLPELRIANLLTDGEILALARHEAFNLIRDDPHVRSSEHQSLRTHIEERLSGLMSLIDVG